jgi:hypothetical protein
MKKCQKCNKSIPKDSKFCEYCGEKITTQSLLQKYGEKWWYRTSVVVYILLLLFSFVAGILSFLDFMPYESSSIVDRSCFSNNLVDCEWNSEIRGEWSEAWFFGAIGFLIVYLIVRILKIIFHYIIFSEKPVWSREFRKFY